MCAAKSFRKEVHVKLNINLLLERKTERKRGIIEICAMLGIVY